jgi:hypothetical protein
MRSLVARHPYGAVFLFALLVRVTLALVVGLGLPQLSFFDDGTYDQLARERLNGRSELWDSYASWLYVHTGTLLFPLTLLYRIFGPSALVGPLFVAIFGAGVAALTARLVAHVLDRRAALIAGALIALLPSQVLVSSVLAKDALTWFLLAALGLVVVTAARTSSLARLSWLVLLSSGLLTLLGLLRLHTMTVAAMALLLAAWFGVRATRAHRLAGFGAVAMIVPFALGIGPVGLQLVANHGSLEGTRAYHATGGSAIEELRPPPVTQPQRPTTAKPPAAPGSDTEEPEPVTAQPEGGGDEVARNLAYLPRGISVILFEPVPWRSDGSRALRLASFEAVVWYPVLALGLVGALTAWRRREVLAFPLLVGGALVCMWALVDGNIGTAFRHRGEIVWAVVVLAAHGLSTLTGRRTNAAYPADPASEPAPAQEPEPVRAR